MKSRFIAKYSQINDNSFKDWQVKICFSHLVFLDFNFLIYEIRIDQMLSKIFSSFYNPEVYIPNAILTVY